MVHLLHREPLEHAGPERAAAGPPKVLHGGDQARLDPADAAPWPRDRNAGLGPGQKAQRLAGVLIEDASAAPMRRMAGLRSATSRASIRGPSGT